MKGPLMIMVRRVYMFACALIALVHTSLAGPADAKPPHVILIMADDLGVEGLNCYGGTSYRTPRLDQLAAEGIRFTHAYSQPLCTNTRIQLMTGLYNNRNWLYFGCLDPRAKTIGHWMQAAGYHTCIAGKWQLYSYDPPQYPGSELRRGKGMPVTKAGFDEYSLWHTGHTELKGPRYADPVVLQDGAFRSDLAGRYGEDVWVEFIVDFMRRHRNQARPFFVYYPMALPHWPFVPTPRGKDWGIREKMHPPQGTTGGDTKYFPDMVSYLDEVVGRLVDAVDEFGLRNDTLILFYSDNGTDRRVTSQTSIGAIRGGKGSTTDAGTHVPLIARWPGRIQPGINDDLVDSTDFLPTVLEAAGQPLGKTDAIDGRSFLPQLLGRPGKPRPWVFCHYDPRPGWDKDKYTLVRFARTKRYKLYGDGRLFDVALDPLEHSAIAADKQTPSMTHARGQLQRVLDSMNSQSETSP